MKNYLIKNATVVNENKIFISDILIKDGYINKIEPNITLLKNNNIIIINAEGLYLFPGMIDDQVHFREPGLNHKGDIESESQAAIAGGITSYMDMPNCNPPTITLDLLNNKTKIANNKSHANFSFYLGATNSNINEIKKLNVNDACGIKIFMGASTGNMLVDNIQILEKIFKHSPILIATHCEDTSIILENEKKFKKKYGNNIPFYKHSEIRSRHACLKSSQLAISLAEKYNSKLNVLHITTEEELLLFEKYKNINLKNKKITSEVCVHHLFFSQKDYIDQKGLIKCNPSIKYESDKTKLLKAVQYNILDIIASDHAPHTWEEKNNNNYFNTPSGLPLVQHSLLILLEKYHKNILTLETIVNKTAHAPAIIYQIKNRGFIREGYYADLVLINLNKKYKILKQNIKYKCQWSPFNNKIFYSTIEKTFVNGVLKYDNNKIISNKLGMKLTFNR